MRKIIFQFYIKLILFSVVVTGLYYSLHGWEIFALKSHEFWRIHGFNFFASLFLYPVLAYSVQYIKDKVGFVFLALSVLKMLLAMVYMAILLIPNSSNMESFAVQFVVIYGIYLVFELYLMVQMLKE